MREERNGVRQTSAASEKTAVMDGSAPHVRSSASPQAAAVRSASAREKDRAGGEDCAQRNAARKADGAAPGKQEQREQTARGAAFFVQRGGKNGGADGEQQKPRTEKHDLTPLRAATQQAQRADQRVERARRRGREPFAVARQKI